MTQKKCLITSIRKTAAGYFLISLKEPSIARPALPGQFVMVQVPSDRFFLRRPFSICRVRKDHFDIVFKVAGAGTEILSRQKKGDILDVIGPLGRGYPFPGTLSPEQDPALFVAGGTGVASLFFLASCLQNQNQKRPSLFFMGAKTKKEIIFKDELERMGYTVRAATDDGSSGSKGLITDLFSKWLASGKGKRVSTVYSCGPRPMLKKVALLCLRKGITCYVSMEEKMACGLGVCMGCAVRTTNREKPLQRACAEGPVFSAREIAWD